MNEDDLKKMFHENFRFKNARFYEIDSFITAADMTSCPEGGECDGDAVTEADTDTSKDIHAGIGF